jgi:hypothetical protein
MIALLFCLAAAFEDSPTADPDDAEIYLDNFLDEYDESPRFLVKGQRSLAWVELNESHWFDDNQTSPQMLVEVGHSVGHYFGINPLTALSLVGLTLSAGLWLVGRRGSQYYENLGTAPLVEGHEDEDYESEQDEDYEEENEANI